MELIPKEPHWIYIIIHNIHGLSVVGVERSGYGLGIFGAGPMQDR